MILASLFLLVACSGSTKQTSSKTDNDNYLFISGGNILTMQGSMGDSSRKHIYDKDYAVLVKGDKITAIGKSTAVINSIPDGSQVEYLDLAGRTLLPGFIEPHAHLQLTVVGAELTNLMPCLPDKYQKIYEQGYGLLYKENDIPGSDKNCLLYLDDAMDVLAASKPMLEGWYLGNGMDPSRMLLNDEKSLNINREFLAYPAKFLQDRPAFKTSPVFILDQSGHLAYVNQMAFKSAGICNYKFDIKTKDYESKAGISLTQEQVIFLNESQGKPIRCEGTKEQMELSEQMAAYQYVFPDGEWGIVESKPGLWTFSGLLKEESAFYPLLNTLKDSIIMPESLEDDMIQVLNVASQQGVTTFAEGGGSSLELINNYKQMAKRSDMPARIRTLYTWDGEWCSEPGDCSIEKVPFVNKEYNSLFSAEGIKLWADGSTQGCSGDLSEAYAKDGLCESYDKGHQNYTKAQIEKNLEKYAKDDWYIHIHANGDQAIKNSVAALKELSSTYDSFAELPSVLIHSTVSGGQSDPLAIPALIEQARNTNLPNLSSSHLIGHVAYWGDSFKNELGNQRAKNIDPTKTEWDKNIPLSLHSDMSITPLYPLWFVEQAVTRNTWSYPELEGDGTPLNSAETLTPYQALMSITIHPAMQHDIDDEVGSLEEGKLADMVVLATNPLEVENTKIHDIEVSCTFLNGKKVKWTKADGTSVADSCAYSNQFSDALVSTGSNSKVTDPQSNQ